MTKTDRSLTERISALAPFVSFAFRNDRCVSASFANNSYVYEGIIRLYSKKDKGKILSLVAKLDHLEHLDLRKNRLLFINNLGHLDRLTYLNLASNYLGETPSWIAQLKSLQYLDLAVNDLVHLPSEYGALPLKVLRIHKNKIIHYPEEYSNMKLIELNMYMNKIKTIPKFLFDSEAMEQFSWGISGLDSIPDEIRRWVNLRYFTMAATKIRSIPDSFCLLLNLKGARLHKNRISNLPSDFGNLCSLEDLTLYSNQLIGLPVSFAKLRLQRLNLSKNLFSQPPMIPTVSRWICI